MYSRIYFNIYRNKISGIFLTKRSFSIYNNELQSKLKSGYLTYYDVLQVPRNADKKAIKEAYLKLVKEYHPDRSKTSDSRSIFICIKESHDVLSDRNKRILYDQKLKQFDSKLPPFSTSRILRTGTGYEPEEDERWERYKRYTSGVRNDREDDPHTGIKTVRLEDYIMFQILAVAFSSITVALVCLVSGEVLSRFPNSSCVDDKYTESDVKHEKMVNAYYNPVTEQWERIIEPFDAPLPDVLINYYKGKVEDLDVDNIPIKNLTTLKMPFGLTVRPTVLYDKSRRRPVYIET